MRTDLKIRTQYEQLALNQTVDPLRCRDPGDPFVASWRPGFGAIIFGRSGNHSILVRGPRLALVLRWRDSQVSWTCPLDLSGE
jgi:hypothetical protein